MLRNGWEYSLMLVCPPNRGQHLPGIIAKPFDKHWRATV